MSATTLRRLSVSFLIASGLFALVALGGLLAAPDVNSDVVRANYTESFSTVAAIDESVGNDRTITTADGLTITDLASACPVAPRALAIGDQVTVATLPSVDGSTPLSMVGPCDPEKMALYVANANYEDSGYLSAPSAQRTGLLLAGCVISMVISLVLFGGETRREKRDERRKDAEREDFLDKSVAS